MADQVGLVEAVCALAEGRVSVVGHFFGGAVVASAARAMNEKVGALVLLEANSFPLLDAHDKHEAHKEFIELRGFTKLHGAKGDWNKVAERFTDYWLGEGAWLPTL
jgi:pimeloyl-ACP methyl ester carboxylesterase